MKVTLLDTQTGKTLEVSNEANAFWWAHGNGCCDCNRSLLMEVETGLPDNICEGKHRFLIIAADSTEYTLTQFNAGYPPELLKSILGDRDERIAGLEPNGTWLKL